jgi:hypothetical protein
MDSFMSLLQNIIPEGSQVETFLKTVPVLLVATAVLGLLGRFIFGKGAVLTRSISSAISILFIYAVTIVIHSLGLNLEFLLSPLPFVHIEGDFLLFMIYDKAMYPEMCNQILSMIILAFVANLCDRWLPKGKKIITWFLFRCLSVIIAMALHLALNTLLLAFLPEGLLTWAPVIMLGLLGLMLLLGVLNLPVGLIVTAVNPVIGIFYNFFFSNIVGKMICKAVLTTAFLAGIVAALHYLGVVMVYIAASALLMYIPFLVVLLLLWYLLGKVF